MRLRKAFLIILTSGISGLYANNLGVGYSKINFIDTIVAVEHNLFDNILEDLNPDSQGLNKDFYSFGQDTISNDTVYNPHFWEKLNSFVPVELDSLTLQSNPFLYDLVYFDKPLKLKWDTQAELQKLITGNSQSSLISQYYEPFKTLDPHQVISELRAEIRRKITLTAPELFVCRFDKLPDSRVLQSHIIDAKPLTKVQFTNNDNIDYTRRKLMVQKKQLGPWTTKANTMIQFSENYVSDNWYQGGSSNIAILGILTGQLNYDNKKNIQWDNNAEWRAGFNTVEGDTVRLLNTNDDIFKVYSKLGIKAGGNWFYSGSVDFSTQFFNNYKAVNSTVMKASFMTPVRLNVSVGLDYKYKKLFSLMLSPVSFKYIYARDIENVSPKLFGIPEGEQVLSQIGSSFKAQFSYAPVREIQLDSKLSFYTNYEKVEIDWEIVGNFTINRYLSTRLSLNPRYDNTVILAAGEKAKLQFKELLSFGFSYKLLN